MPSFDSPWIRLTGVVPVALSGKDTCSESVVIPLKKGASVPLVLKKARVPDGRDSSGDVATELVVESYENDPEGQGKILWIALNSPHRLGWRDFEIMTLEGGHFMGQDSDYSYDARSGWWWHKRFIFNGIDAGILRVSVRYDSDLSKVLVPVNLEVGLSGFKQVSDEAHSTK